MIDSGHYGTNGKPVGFPVSDIAPKQKVKFVERFLGGTTRDMGW